MYAAYKGTLITAVLYVGLTDDRYPEWVYDTVITGAEVDHNEVLKVKLTDENDYYFNYYTLVPYQTVILKNRFGDIRTINYIEFGHRYVYMGKDWAALKSDTVEYAEITPETDIRHVPYWLREYVGSGWQVDEAIFYSFDGEYAMSPTSIFVRNSQGHVQYAEPETFDDVFVRAFK